jgi:ABC-2 type transport system ATP-binding protein
MASIRVQGLTKRYGPVTAVNGLSFEVQPGTVTGFLGPNGAGKTTTLRALLGLVTPDEGTATVNGLTYRALPDPLHQVGAMLEASSCHPGRTARAHLRIQALAAEAAPSRIDDVLDLVGLADAGNRRVGGFSLGMRQRLGLATALLADPEVLILDEPANGLDPEGVRWLRGLLRGFAEEGGTVLVSSHLLAEVSQTVDSVVIIGHGRLVVQGPVAELTAGGAGLEDVYFQLTQEAV